ncbi:hypothetical protein L3Q67_12105 [Saccharothrix sp. AJ9571]|nr:hypothetical protein L3Q67_12105 [Saccharothrix sp. AJ9571]
MRSALAEAAESVTPPDSGGRPGPRSIRFWAFPAGAAAVSAVVFVLAKPHLIDDTYITLSYAKNLALHGHYGLIADGVANTATSPLNVLSLAALTVVVRDAVFAAAVLFVLAQVLLALGLRRLGERIGLPAWFAPLGMALTTINPLLISSIGLEIALGAAGVVWALVYATERRPVALGVVIGALALIRLDLLVMALVVFVARRSFWTGIWRTFFAALAVAGPWFTISWFTLGSAVPDTVIIKTLQRSWGEWSFTNGPLLYFQDYPAQTVLSFLPVALAAVLCLLWLALLTRGSDTARRILPFGVLALAGFAHYLAYSWLNVPPYHWYYGPSIAATTVFLAAAVASVDGVAFRQRVLAGVGLAGTAVVAAVAVAVYLAPGLPRQYAPLTSNHAASEQYLEIGEQLAQVTQGRKVHSAGEIGALAYACDCPIVDLFSDRGAVGPAIAESESRASALGKALIDLNFRFFDHTLAPADTDLVLEVTHEAPPPTALASWTITSPWSGTQQLYLVSAANARPVGEPW